MRRPLSSWVVKDFSGHQKHDPYKKKNDILGSKLETFVLQKIL